MALMTEEQAKKIRIKNSEVTKVSGEVELRIVEISGRGAMEIDALQNDIKSGKKSKTDLIKFLVTNACAALDGSPLTEKDADMLLDTCSMGELSELISKVNAKMSAKTPAAPAGKN